MTAKFFTTQASISASKAANYTATGLVAEGKVNEGEVFDGKSN
jgi:hypothetical protein